MTAISTTPKAPSFLWRVATLLGLWFIIFGVITALTPLHMEAGYDVTHEKIRATLCTPILSWFGMAAFLGGHRPSYLPAIASLLVILGSPLLIHVGVQSFNSSLCQLLISLFGIAAHSLWRFWIAPAIWSMSHNQTPAQVNHLLTNIGGMIRDSIDGFHNS